MGILPSRPSRENPDFTVLREGRWLTDMICHKKYCDCSLTDIIFGSAENGFQTRSLLITLVKYESITLAVGPVKT